MRAACALLLLLLLAGCVQPHRVGCIRHGFCGPYAGVYVVGSTSCYTPDTRVGLEKDTKAICD